MLLRLSHPPTRLEIMFGPVPLGKWSALARGKEHDFLRIGHRYRVTRQFVDYDKAVHPPGEEWAFLGCSFVPYDDGMTFFVSLDGIQEWQIPLQWRREEQGEILDTPAEFLTEVPAPGVV